MKIASLEDDLDQALRIQQVLTTAGYACSSYQQSRDLLAALRTEHFDLVLLDWHLPDIDGDDVVRWLRANIGPRIPVIFLTNRSSEDDLVEGQRAGADDYIVKPYDLDELLARIRALLRRADGRAEPAYEWGEVRIVPATREVTLKGEPVPLSAREWAVLEPLLARPGRVLSRQQLEEKLYSWRDDISSNAVEVYIHGVRKKLGAGLIENQRGLGYRVPPGP